MLVLNKNPSPVPTLPLKVPNQYVLFRIHICGLKKKVKNDWKSIAFSGLISTRQTMIWDIECGISIGVFCFAMFSLFVLMTICLHVRQKSNSHPLGERKMSFSNWDQTFAQHLFKISPNCNEGQFSVSNMGGVPQHTGSRCENDVRMTHVGELCVSVREDWVKGWSVVTISCSWFGFH